MEPKRRCPWKKCWWGAIVVPGMCFENGNMEDPDCPLFKDEEETLAEQVQLSQIKRERLNEIFQK